MRTVHAYYVPIRGFPGEELILREWRKSWAKHGWDPVVIGLEEAHKNAELYRELVAQTAKLKTVNSRQYEIHCYLRHLAMANVGGGLMTDYDVMNYGFGVDELPIEPPDHMVFLDPSKVPCAIFGSPRAFRGNCYKFIATGKGEITFPRTHISDMIIIQEMIEGERKPCVVEYGVPGWETARLVHFASCACANRGGCPKRDRAAFIRKVRPV